MKPFVSIAQPLGRTYIETIFLHDLRQGSNGDLIFPVAVATLEGYDEYKRQDWLKTVRDLSDYQIIVGPDILGRAFLNLIAATWIAFESPIISEVTTLVPTGDGYDEFHISFNGTLSEILSHEGAEILGLKDAVVIAPNSCDPIMRIEAADAYWGKARDDDDEWVCLSIPNNQLAIDKCRTLIRELHLRESHVYEANGVLGEVASSGLKPAKLADVISVAPN